MTDKRFSINAELRAAAGDSEMTIRGKAVCYDALSSENVPMAGYREKISPGCFRSSLADGHDILALTNHQSQDLPLGRTSNGTLKLTDGADALRFEIRLNPDVQAHRDVYNLVKDGTLNGVSFAFSGAQDEWDERRKVRIVRSARIHEISIVNQAAYPDTDVQARALAEQAEKADVDALREHFEKVRLVW